jgi:hypothetical protein
MIKTKIKYRIWDLDPFFFNQKKLSKSISFLIFWFYSLLYRNLDYKYEKLKIFVLKVFNFLLKFLTFLKVFLRLNFFFYLYLRLLFNLFFNLLSQIILKEQKLKGVIIYYYLFDFKFSFRLFYILFYFIFRIFYIGILIYKFLRYWIFFRNVERGSFYKTKFFAFCNYFIFRHFKSANYSVNYKWWILWVDRELWYSKFFLLIEKLYILVYTIFWSFFSLVYIFFFLFLYFFYLLFHFNYQNFSNKIKGFYFEIYDLIFILLSLIVKLPHLNQNFYNLLFSNVYYEDYSLKVWFEFFFDEIESYEDDYAIYAFFDDLDLFFSDNIHIPFKNFVSFEVLLRFNKISLKLLNN